MRSGIVLYTRDGGEEVDSEILEALYRAHYGAALLYTLSLCGGDRALAEDIVAAAFETALLTLGDAHENFRAWLLLVCRSRWTDEMRRRSRRKQVSLEDTDAPTPDTAAERLLRTERDAALYRALGRLAERDRELVTLHYFSGLGVAEAASILGISPGAAKTALFRARMKLRRWLEEDGYGI